jgi:hypothetical protein
MRSSMGNSKSHILPLSGNVDVPLGLSLMAVWPFLRRWRFLSVQRKDLKSNMTRMMMMFVGNEKKKRKELGRQA